MSQKFLSSIKLTGLTGGSILKINADGVVVEAVAGTDYITSVSAGNLDSLTDVVITSPSADQILVYGQPIGGEPGVNIWYNKTPNYLTPASSINALGDVSINSIAVGNLLSWNGSNWVNWAPNFLTSYTETDPIYTASSWYTTTNNASNWDTAYGWGNHSGLYANLVHTHSVFTQATSGVVNGQEVTIPGENGFVPASGLDDGGKFLRGDGTWQVVTTDLTGYATETWVGQQGYLTSYTETDPVFKGSAAYGISTENISSWNTMVEWGNHADAGYLTSYTETDPIYTASSWYTTTNNASNWDTAYGWGNHASAGYQAASTAITTSNIGSQYVEGANRLGSYTSNTASSFQAWNLYEAGTARLNPTADTWYYGMRISHGDAENYYSATLAISFFNEDLYLRRIQGGTPATWYRFWHNGDFGTGNISNWNTAYGWGNHADAGYLTAETDSQTLEWNQGEKTLTISNGNSVDLSQMASVQDVEAYGFITGESDTLHTVTNRGTVTSNSISVEQSVGGGFVYRTDTNWAGWDRNGFSFANGSGTVFKSLGAYGGDGNSLSYMYIGTNHTSHSIRFGSDYTYFPGLDLSISNANSDHGTGTYFRGSSSHFVLGLRNGNTLYLNYGNDGGGIWSYGTQYHHNNYIINGNGYGIILYGGNNRIYFENNGVQRRALEGNSDQLQIGEGYNYTLLQANYSTVATVNTYGFGIGQYAASNEKLAVSTSEGLWGLSVYRSGTQIGGIHTNSGILTVQGSSGNEVRLATSGNATWNGDILATRTWVAAQGYLTSETDSQTLEWNQGEKTLTISNGNSVDLGQMASVQDVEAYGFITGESDTLQTVVSRGNSTSSNIRVKRPSNKIDNNSNPIEFGGRIEFNNDFVAGQSGYMVFRYPTYNNFLIGGDYDGNIGGAIPNIQFGRSNGTVYMHIDASAGTGNVGIGTTSPTDKLQVVASTYNGITITTPDVATLKMRSSGGGTTNWGFATTNLAASDFGIYESNAGGGDPINAGTARLYFKTGGNVGIGTTGPISKLDIVGSHTGGYGILKITSTDSAFISVDAGNSDGGLRLKYNTGDQWLIGIRGNDKLQFNNAADQPKLVIQQDGNVGIGTSSPAFTLDVNGNAAIGTKLSVGTAYNGFALNVAGTAYIIGGSVWTQNGYGYVNSGATGTGMFPDSNHVITFKNNNSANVTIDASGNVGIGTTSPTGKLSVNGGISQNNIVGRPKAYWGVGGASNGAIVISFPGGYNNYGMVHAVVDIYEYNSNNVSTVIVGGHNWGGRWYNYGANTVGYTDKQIRVSYKDGRYAIIIGDENSSWSYGQVVLRKIQNGDYYAGVMNVSDGYDITQTQDLTADWMSENLTGLKTTYATVNGNGSGSSNSLFVNGFITGSAHGASERLAISFNTRLWFYDSNAEIYRSGSSMFLYGHDEIRMSSSAGNISVGNSTWTYSNSEPYVAGQVYNGQAGNSRFMFHSGNGVMNVYTDGNFYAVEGTQKVATETWVSAQGYAVQQDIAEAVSNLVNSSPEALDTLGELAAALGNDANFATTVTNSLAGKVSKSGDTVSGDLAINGVWSTTISTGGGWNKLSFTASNAWGDGTTYGVLGAGTGENGVMTYNQHATWAGSSNGAGIRMGRSGGVASGAWYQVATMDSDEFMIAKNGSWGNGGIKITSGGELQHGNSGNKYWHAGNDGAGSGLDADYLDGYHASSFAIRQDGSRYSTDFNGILSSGFYNAEGTPPNAPGHYGQLIVAKGIDTALQIYGGYSNDELWFRGWGYGPEADGFYAWRKVWHDGNFNPTSYLPLTGSTMSGSINMNGNNITNIGQVSAAHAIFTNDASSRVMYLRGTGNIIQFQDAAANNKWEIVGREGTFYIYKGDGTGSGYKYQIDTNGNHTITGDVAITGSLSASGYNKSNWDTAYGWGNHATANYWVTSNTDPQIVAASSVTFQYDVEIQGQLLETSSLRFKENIVDLEPVAEKVNQLRPVRYNKIGSDVQEIGLIAEEVSELFPEVVHYNEDGEAESLNYTRLSVLLLQTVKELSDRIQKLENK